MKNQVRRTVPLVNKRMILVLMGIEDWTYLNDHDYRKQFDFDFHPFFDHHNPNISSPNQHRVHQMTLGFGQTLMDRNYEFELPWS